MLSGERWAILPGKVEEVVSELGTDYFDAVLCDPPYGFSLMGKKWDYQVPSQALWQAALLALKPGAPILAFGGSRTYHRLVVNLEDAGAEIRDQIAWIYGSGFPKSLDASKAIDSAFGVEQPGFPEGTLGERWQGYGTALKPALEPIVLARKPLDGTLAQNIGTYGCGPLSIYACRISGEPVPINRLEKWSGFGQKERPDYTQEMNTLGRWPANVILDEEAGGMLDEQSGNRPGMSSGGTGRRDASMFGVGGVTKPETVRGDSGGASRFFYCSKASKSEREAGLDHLPPRSGGEVTDRKDGSAGLNSPRSGAGRNGGRRNFHPTVKPLALLRYLARLIKPAVGGRILVPFSGSGSEMIACLLEGYEEVIGIEMEPDYLPIAEARILHHLKGSR